MKYLVKPQYQYYLIPLTIPWIWFIATCNYMYFWNDKKQAFKLFWLAVLFGLAYVLIPVYLTALFGIPDITKSSYNLLYLELMSILPSIYIINGQNRYVKARDNLLAFEEEYLVAKNYYEKHKLFYKDISKIIFKKQDGFKGLEVYEADQEKPSYSLGLLFYSDDDIKSLLESFMSRAPKIFIKTPLTWKYHRYIG